MPKQAEILCTVGEVIDILSKFDRNTEIMGTYENRVGPIYIYQASNGVVLVDADGGDYQAVHQRYRRKYDKF